MTQLKIPRFAAASRVHVQFRGAIIGEIVRRETRDYQFLPNMTGQALGLSSVEDNLLPIKRYIKKALS